MTTRTHLRAAGRSLPAIFAVLVGCSLDRDFAPIIVDIASNCAAAEVEKVLGGLDDEDQPWESVFAAALDAPGLDRLWMLVSARDEANQAQLALVHVDDGRVDAEFVLSGSGLGEVDFDLLAGPTPGQAYLVARGSATFRIWQVDAAVPANPLVAVSPDLGGFPFANNCDPDSEGNLGPCDTSEWFRGLGFVDGQAIIVSVPPMSPTATMFMHVASLGAGLSLNQTTQLEFVRECDPEDPSAFAECNDIENSTYPAIDVLGFQLDPTRLSQRVFMVRERAVLGVLQELELVNASIQLDDARNISAILQSKAPRDVELAKGRPGGIAVDDFAAYLLHPTNNRGPVVTRLSSTAGTFDVLSDIVLGEEDALVQMDGDVALARINDEGHLEITKLFPDDPQRSMTTVYDAPGVVAFEPAGVGALLVHKEADGPDVIRLRCADPLLDEKGG